MIEVRSFEGTPEELSQFVVGCWRGTYRGRIAVPDWPADYFRWQLRLDEPDSSRRLVAAYSGAELAGVVLFAPVDLELHGTRLRGSQASWLSVSPAFQGQGIAKKLQQGCRERHRELGLSMQLGYVYFGSRASLGGKFWLKSQKSHVDSIATVGFWARVLDPVRAARWNLSRWEGWLTRLAAPLIPLAPVREISGVRIRDFTEGDLNQCLALLDRATGHCPLRLIWNAEQLQRHLTGWGQGLVAEVAGQVQGFISFHTLQMLGLTEEPVGIIDLIACTELTPAVRVALLDSALLRLRQLGAVVALKLRSGDYPTGLMARWGWMWRPSDSYLTVAWPSEPIGNLALSRFHLLWR